VFVRTDCIDSGVGKKGTGKKGNGKKGNGIKGNGKKGNTPGPGKKGNRKKGNQNKCSHTDQCLEPDMNNPRSLPRCLNMKVAWTTNV